mmetsp:Transcript_9405/g.21381  ORF Transcript_9405/g.21381 Transcript_9405/m.21381 type:complete len:196 (-) Transcript_9405:177-764(-)
MAIGAVRASREARKRAKERDDAERKARARQIFASFDKDSSGALSSKEVSQMLTQLGDGTPPTEAELAFIMHTSDTRPPAGHLGAEEFASALSSWRCYQSEFSEPTSMGYVMFERHDTDKTGWLNRAQLKGLLADLKGEPISDVDVEWVMSKGDIMKDNKISKLEFKMVVAAWFQKVMQEEPPPDPKNKSSACTLL